MSTDRKILTGFAGSAGLSLATIAVSVFQLRLLLHFLPQATVGIWLLFTSMGAYVVYLDLGLTPTLGREISFVFGRTDLSDGERTRQIATLIRSCTRVVSIVSVAVYGIAAVAGWAYIRTVVHGAAPPRLHAAWLIFAAGACLNLVGEGWFAGIYGLGEVFAEKLIRSSGVLIGFVMLVATVLLGWGLEGLAAAWFVQTVLTLAGARYRIGRLQPGVKTQGRVDLALIRRMALPSLKYSLTVLGGVLILQTDNLVIASTLGTTVIPNYQAVARIVMILMTLSMMLVVVASPFMSRAHAAADHGEIRRLLERNQRFSLGVLVISSACLACFADRLVLLWLGPGHFIGFGVVWVLLAVTCLEAHHLAMATATMSTGRIVFVWPALIAGALNLVFSIVLAHRMGALGVALGTLCAQVLTNNWYVPFYAMRQFHITLGHQLRRVILPILGLAGATLLVGSGMRYATRTLPNAAGLLLGTVVAGVAGMAIFFVLVLSAGERETFVREIRRRLPGARMAPQ